MRTQVLNRISSKFSNLRTLFFPAATAYVACLIGKKAELLIGELHLRPWRLQASELEGTMKSSEGWWFSSWLPGTWETSEVTLGLGCWVEEVTSGERVGGKGSSGSQSEQLCAYLLYN